MELIVRYFNCLCGNTETLSRNRTTIIIIIIIIIIITFFDRLCLINDTLTCFIKCKKKTNHCNFQIFC